MESQALEGKKKGRDHDTNSEREMIDKKVMFNLLEIP